LYLDLTSNLTLIVLRFNIEFNIDISTCNKFIAVANIDVNFSAKYRKY